MRQLGRDTVNAVTISFGIGMARVALYTFGILAGPHGSEVVREFVAALPSVFAESEQSPGFVGHALAARPDLLGKPRLGQPHGAWGTYVAPRYGAGDATGALRPFVATLSLWHDTGAARRFTYNGLHRSALMRRAEWFVKGPWPGYVLWWVENDETPTWEEGVRRLEWLGDHGPSLVGFDFKQGYDGDGGAEPRLRSAAG
jgi:hypothetical protein